MGGWSNPFGSYDAPFSNSGSSNQWGQLPSSNPPTSPTGSGGTAITGGSGNVFNSSQPTQPTYVGSASSPNGVAGVGGLPTLGSSSSANSNAGSVISPLSPTFSQDYLEWLGNQIGQGLPNFQGSLNLPSGGSTSPGQLTAPENSVLAQLQNFLTTGQGGGNPGLDAATQMATTGDPTNVMPEWQAMIAAMQQPTAQGAAQLQEQFANSGAAQSSVYGQSLANYYNQAGLNEQSLLGQLTESSLESAANRAQSSQQSLLGLDQSTSQYIQGLDQSSINNLLQNYYSTLPQYNPLLSSEYGASVTFPPYVSGSYGTSGLAPALGAAASVAAGASSGGGTPSGTPSTYPATQWG